MRVHLVLIVGPLSQVISLAPSASPWYSASVVDTAIVGCSLLLHWIEESPILKSMLVVDFHCRVPSPVRIDITGQCPICVLWEVDAFICCRFYVSKDSFCSFRMRCLREVHESAQATYSKVLTRQVLTKKRSAPTMLWYSSWSIRSAPMYAWSLTPSSISVFYGRLIVIWNWFNSFRMKPCWFRRVPWSK